MEWVYIFLPKVQEKELPEYSRCALSTNAVCMRRLSRRARDVALIALVLQNSLLILVSKLSFRPTAPEYNPKLVVLLAECVKFFACAVAVVLQNGWSAICLDRSYLMSNIVVVLPCLLYLAQNNLQFIAIRELPTCVYVACAQLKILTSAFFSVCLLKKVLNVYQLFSVFTLMVGVVMVQLGSVYTSSAEQQLYPHGVLCLLLACTFSGLAGTLLERWYKREDDSIWVRNMYLSMITLPLAVLSVKSELKHLSSILEWDRVICAVVFLQAAGGLIVAGVMKFASNLIKCFAVSISILICDMVSIILNGSRISALAAGGTSLVISSVWLYSMRPCKPSDA